MDSQKSKTLQELIAISTFLNDLEVSSSTNKTIPLLLADGELVSKLMKHIVATNEALSRLIKRPSDLWFTHKEAQKFFGVTAGTLRNWRQQGLLGFSQRDRVIMIHFSEIEKFLKNHAHQAFQYKK